MSGGPRRDPAPGPVAFPAAFSGERRIVAAAALTAVLAGAVLAGCGDATGPGPTDASVADVRAADERLQGQWRLVDFRPETPLDPVMAGMLSFYQPKIIIEVERGRIRALSSAPGLHFDRRYEVRDAVQQRFELVVWDDEGIAQSVLCELQPDGTLRAKTTYPWRGDAVLARAR